MNFVCSVVPSFLRRQTFFESLQCAQSVVYKSSYLLKYNVKVTSSSGKYEKFSIALQMAFCEKDNSFSMGLLRLVSCKTCFWNSSCLSWFSFWVCRSNFKKFLPAERAVVFTTSLPFFLEPTISVYSGTLPDLIKNIFEILHDRCVF